MYKVKRQITDTPAVTGAKFFRGFHVGRSAAKHRAKRARKATAKKSTVADLRRALDVQRNHPAQFKASRRLQAIVRLWKKEWRAVLAGDLGATLSHLAPDALRNLGEFEQGTAPLHPELRRAYASVSPSVALRDLWERATLQEVRELLRKLTQESWKAEFARLDALSQTAEEVEQVKDRYARIAHLEDEIRRSLPGREDRAVRENPHTIEELQKRKSLARKDAAVELKVGPRMIYNYARAGKLTKTKKGRIAVDHLFVKLYNDTHGSAVNT